MNGKPGDLAYVVRSLAGNAGRVVTCIRLASEAELGNARFAPWLGPVWVTDKCLAYSLGGTTNLAPDQFRHPIRPDDISDEEVRDLYAPKLPETAIA